MALIDIDYGGIATSQLLNDNFHYLDQSINAVGVTVSGHTSSITSLGNQITNVSNTLTASINELSSKVDSIAVTGSISWFAGDSVPTGYLLCDGTAKSRTDYADLFEVIGTTFGVGDSSTTFNLPNLINKLIKGSSTAGTYNTEMQTNNTNLNHSHQLFGAINTEDWNGYTGNALEEHKHSFELPTLTILPCIKY